MGLHLCIQDKQGVDHPSWDSMRQEGDEENAAILAKDCITWHSGESFYEDDVILMRPTETTKLIGERGKYMLELLKDPKWWVYLSV